MAVGTPTFLEGDFPPLPTSKVSTQPKAVEISVIHSKSDLIVGDIPIHIPNPILGNKITPANQPQFSSSVEESKIAKAFSCQLAIRPKHQINGNSCISFKAQDKLHLLSKIRYVIVAKFSHGRPRLFDFHMFLSNMRLTGNYNISEFDSKHVFVEFHIFEDFVKIWLLKSRLINGFRVRFFHWGGDFHPAAESSVAPIWIHLPALPLYLFDEDCIISIASLFGKLLYIDPRNMEKRMVGCLSFCVAKDVRFKGIDGFWIEFVGEGKLVERFWQRVNYGDVPSFCASCLHLGHRESECKLPKPNNLDSVGERIAGGLETLTEVPVFKVFGRLVEDIGAHGSGSSATDRNLKQAASEEVLIEDGSNKEGDVQTDYNTKTDEELACHTSETGPQGTNMAANCAKVEAKNLGTGGISIIGSFNGSPSISKDKSWGVMAEINEPMDYSILPFQTDEIANAEEGTVGAIETVTSEAFDKGSSGLPNDAKNGSETASEEDTEISKMDVEKVEKVDKALTVGSITGQEVCTNAHTGFVTADMALQTSSPATYQGPAVGSVSATVSDSSKNRRANKFVDGTSIRHLSESAQEYIPKLKKRGATGTGFFMPLTNSFSILHNELELGSLGVKEADYEKEKVIVDELLSSDSDPSNSFGTKGFNDNSSSRAPLYGSPPGTSLPKASRQDKCLDYLDLTYDRDKFCNNSKEPTIEVQSVQSKNDDPFEEASDYKTGEHEDLEDYKLHKVSFSQKNKALTKYTKFMRNKDFLERTRGKSSYFLRHRKCVLYPP